MILIKITEAGLPFWGGSAFSSVPLEAFSRGGAVAEFAVWPRFIMRWETAAASVPLEAFSRGSAVAEFTAWSRFIVQWETAAGDKLYSVVT